ncbi:MAG: hypothetical protein FWF88_03735 [Peptococcaceae bacterium]|nr:hypothetical protein [Peptococcaceae bacterium]
MEILATLAFLAMMILMFMIIYVLPLTGVIYGIVLLKRKRKREGVVILTISALVCTAVIAWRITQFLLLAGYQ